MKKDTLRAILFDFDGVLADTEPLHLEMFQKTLQAEGIPLSREAYFEKYLGLDDRSCFVQVYRDAGRTLDGTTLEGLVKSKNKAVLERIRGRSLLLPGVADLIALTRQRYFLTIVSGALRSEIQAVLDGAGVGRSFHAIVAADDVSQGKPHPEGFQTAIRILNRDFIPPAEILLAGECLAIEDSPWGIEASKAAGVKCLAVATSYDESRLKGADLIVKSPASIPWDKVEALFSG